MFEVHIFLLESDTEQRNLLTSETTYAQVDRLEDELVGEQDKFKAITEELDQTFAEMSGY
jgi:hypothetical protein